jgi:1-acyl-sn-glycerol-3-phosphate acyltransferase
MGLIGSMAGILKNRRLRVELTVFAPAKATPGLPVDRKVLALQSQEHIAQYLAKNCN